MGISLFAGKTKLCVGAATASYATCFGAAAHVNGFLVPKAWVNNPFGSFDDFSSRCSVMCDVLCGICVMCVA